MSLNIEIESPLNHVFLTNMINSNNNNNDDNNNGTNNDDSNTDSKVINSYI